jgi:signal transduction histidine kinase
VAEAIEQGRLGDLFWRVDDPVVLFQSGEVVAWNPASRTAFALTPSPMDADADALRGALGAAADEFFALVREGVGGSRLHCTGGCELVLDVTVWRLRGEGVVAALFRDVTRRQRLTDGMARLSALGRELLDGEPSLPDLLQRITDEAKAITGGAFSAVMLVRSGREAEVTHFAYNAPRDLFPERLPRVVGLLEVALGAGGPVRLADIRGASAGVGIPVKHPPIAALLAAPVVAGDQLMGLVAVANEPGQREFDESDETLIVDLAAHAATAVRWAQARELADMTAERRRESIAVARHDVRNPLTAGKGYARMLASKADRMPDQMKTEAYQHLVAVFDRIEEFTERLLLSDDMPPPAGTPRWEDIRIDDMLRRLLADHTAAAKPTYGELVLFVQPDVPDHMRADPSLAREALDNLIGNAFKYGAPGEPITVTVRSEGDQVRFDVHNLGEGIAAEDQTHVFERYWRPERVRSGAIPGTGLGLAIVREIAEAHGGLVGVSSRPEEGTTFWVTFPAAVGGGTAQSVDAKGLGPTASKRSSRT